MVGLTLAARRVPAAADSEAGMAGVPASSPIDMVYLARQCGGDESLESELLALFADQCVKHLDAIRAFEGSRACDAAHTLKGAARAIGAWQVADAAEKVESSLRAGTGPVPGDEIEELGRAALDARQSIASMRRAA